MFRFGWWSGFGVCLVLVVFLSMATDNRINFWRRNSKVPGRWVSVNLLSFPSRVFVADCDTSDLQWIVSVVTHLANCTVETEASEYSKPTHWKAETEAKLSLEARGQEPRALQASWRVFQCDCDLARSWWRRVVVVLLLFLFFLLADVDGRGSMSSQEAAVICSLSPGGSLLSAVTTGRIVCPGPALSPVDLCSCVLFNVLYYSWVIKKFTRCPGHLMIDWSIDSKTVTKPSTSMCLCVGMNHMVHLRWEKLLDGAGPWVLLALLSIVAGGKPSSLRHTGAHIGGSDPLLTQKPSGRREATVLLFVFFIRRRRRMHFSLLDIHIVLKYLQMLVVDLQLQKND